MRTSKRIQSIACTIGMITGVILVDGEPTLRELIGGTVLILVVVANLLVAAYRNEFTDNESNI